MKLKVKESATIEVAAFIAPEMLNNSYERGHLANRIIRSLHWLCATG
jgi:hypothetical protein